MRAFVFALLVLVLLPIGCGGAATPTARTVSMRLHGGPPQATVTIDDIVVGPLNVVMAKGVALRPGAHRVSVEAPGYLPWDKLIEAKDAAVILEVVLAAVPE